MIRQVLVFGLTIALAAYAAAPSIADEAAATDGNGSRVLATVNGETITEAEFNMILSAASENPADVSAEDKMSLIEQVVDMMLVAQAGEKANVQDNPDYKREMKLIRQQQIYKYYLTDEIVNKTEVSDEEISAYYNANRDQFMEVESVSVSHIQVDTREKAEEIKARLDAGEDFAELAKAESIGAGSDRGGHLGTIGRGMLGYKEFEDAAFALEEGQVSDPVKTELGWHIIKVGEHKKAMPKPLDEVKDGIKAMLLNQKQEQAYKEMVEKLRADAKINVDKDALGATAETVEPAE